MNGPGRKGQYVSMIVPFASGLTKTVQTEEHQTASWLAADIVEEYPSDLKMALEMGGTRLTRLRDLLSWIGSVVDLNLSMRFLFALWRNRG